MAKRMADPIRWLLAGTISSLAAWLPLRPAPHHSSTPSHTIDYNTSHFATNQIYISDKQVALYINGNDQGLNAPNLSLLNDYVTCTPKIYQVLSGFLDVESMVVWSELWLVALFVVLV